MFKKSKTTGVVYNFGTEEYNEYQRRKATMKELMNTKNQLKDTRRDYLKLQSELAEIKAIVTQVLEKKE